MTSTGRPFAVCCGALAPCPRSRQLIAAAPFSPLPFVLVLLIWQVMRGASCRTTLVHAMSMRPDAQFSADNPGYCKARGRLSDQVLVAASNQITSHMERITPPSFLWCGHRVKLVDGSTIRLNDTPENQAAYPQPSTQKPGLGFPQMRVCGLFSLENSALLHLDHASHYVGELKMFRRQVPLLDEDDVLAGDRGFSSYYDMELIARRGAFFVLRQNATLKDGVGIGVLMREAPCLELHIESDEDCVLRRPARPPKSTGLTHEQWKTQVPSERTVRRICVCATAPGFRTQKFYLLTNLLDRTRYSAADIADLYRRRWQVETWLRDFKQTLNMAHLAVLSPAMAGKMLLAGVVAYNLVRAVMLEAAAGARLKNPDRLSFKSAVDLLLSWFAKKKRGFGLRRLFELAARFLNSERPNRVEPRRKKDRGTNYPKLTKPRHEHRQELHDRQTGPACA